MSNHHNSHLNHWDLDNLVILKCIMVRPIILQRIMVHLIAHQPPTKLIRNQYKLMLLHHHHNIEKFNRFVVQDHEVNTLLTLILIEHPIEHLIKSLNPLQQVQQYCLSVK